MKTFLLPIVYLMIVVGSVHAQSPVFELNKKLGRGVNMGNMFEAPTETDWGNPFKDDYFLRISSLGFNHVRIPIRWDTPARTQQTSPYTISKLFLDRIKYVVDKALSEKLYVVINMHHHDEIFQQPDLVKPRFLAQWRQIAEFFKDYDNRVLFEVLNEPNTNLVPDKWNVFFADALSEIRKTNPTRAVLMGTPNWGGLGGVPLLKVPKDNNLILTVHYYDPFNFTHQGAEWVTDANKWLGTKWENTNLEREEIVKQFDYISAFAKQNNMPIHIGEFGSYNKADLNSRVKWSNFLARWFEQQGFSWVYWEFSAGFGIYNPTTNQYLSPLVDALLKDPMSEPNTVKSQKIYESKFDAADSWALYLQPQAKATINQNSGTATIDVTQASADAWHVQLVRTDINLKKNNRYLVTFDGMASADTPVANYLGKATSPYNSYSGFKSFTFTNTWQSFTYSFEMADNDDPKARIVFDLASKVAKISIKNVVVQEVLNPVAGTAYQNKVEVYPNPSSDILIIDNATPFKEGIIQDLHGRVLIHVPLNTNSPTMVSLKSMASGAFFVTLRNDNEQLTKKLIKQ